jgi:hypothetical protein
LSPDLVSPPRADEPVAKAEGTGGGAANAGTPNLEAQKTLALNAIADKAPTGAPPAQPAPVLPTPVVPTPVVPTPVQPVPVPGVQSGILWGRWVQFGPYYPKFNLATETANATLVLLDADYALLRTKGNDYVSPNSGSIGFVLRDSDVVLITDYGYGSRTVAAASAGNGALNVDFGKRTFATRFDVFSKDETLPFQATGTVGADGRLYGDSANGRNGVLNVQGLLSNDKGGAAYIFNGKVDALRSVNGATYWQQR